MKTKMPPKLLALFVASATDGHVSAQHVLYLENFSNPGGFHPPGHRRGLEGIPG